MIKLISVTFYRMVSGVKRYWVEVEINKFVVPVRLEGSFTEEEVYELFPDLTVSGFSNMIVNNQ